MHILAHYLLKMRVAPQKLRVTPTASLHKTNLGHDPRLQYDKRKRCGLSRRKRDVRSRCRYNLWTTVYARQQMMGTRKILDMSVTNSPRLRSVDRMSRRMTVKQNPHHGIVLATPPIPNPSRCLQVCPKNQSRHSEICPASNHPHLYVLGTRVAVGVPNSHLTKALSTVRDGAKHHGGTGRGTDGYPMPNIERRPCWLACRRAMHWRFTREEVGNRKGKGRVRRSIRVFRALALDFQKCLT